MEKELISMIERVNYWGSSPQNLGFTRQAYLDKLNGLMHANLLKVLVGQRRSGKSVILKQFIDTLLKQGIAAHNIFYLNFELHGLSSINNTQMLSDVIQWFFTSHKPTRTVYLFFDEIQEVESWERVINSYLANDSTDAQIFLTGSNAHLLSTELSTYVTGRYVEIPVFPFSFREYTHYLNHEQDKINLIDFIDSSGIPELFRLNEESQKVAYINALKDSIIMNDIVKRFQIKNPKLLLLLLDFAIDNIGHLFSFNAIVKKLKGLGHQVNVTTVSNYMHYLEKTFLIHAIPRYDVRGKKLLEGERKYYLNDLGFYNYIRSSFDNDINRRLENYVYLELLHAGYKVYVGNIYDLEIDFVAQKNQQILYIQVTYLLHSDDVVAREYGNLERIRDSWPKYVVSLDDVKFPPRQGIQHIPAWQLTELLANQA